MLQLRKRRKRKTKPYGDQGKGIDRDFVLPIMTQDVIECVIRFSIDSPTIKRDDFMVNTVI